MKNPNSKVLLIEFSGNKMKMLLQMLTNLGYNVISANSIESAIQKTMSFAPEAILCFEDLDEYTGFQMYNMLEQEIVKKGIPFILVFSEYSRTDVLMAQELGIDAFIFPPFDAETIHNILQSRIRKFHVSKSLSFGYFRKLYELLPIGIFIAENKKIIEANNYFYQMINPIADFNHTISLDELFDFNTNASDKVKLSRFLNGISKSCVFAKMNWLIHNKPNIKLTLHYLENGTHTFKIVGSVLSLDEKDKQSKIINKEASKKNGTNGYKIPEEIEYLTKRELEILNLSAEGLPIKIIAANLNISERTVEKHRSNILRKTNSGNIIEALALLSKQEIYAF